MSAAAKSEDWHDALASMRGLLELTEVYPDLLPPALDAVDGNLHEQIGKRLAEWHPCLRCGDRARLTYLASRRDYEWRSWFDTCHACSALLRAVINEENTRDPGLWDGR